MIEGSSRVSRFDGLYSWTAAVVFSALGIYIIASREHYSYLDYFSLIIHEAGHWLFGWGGETVMMLGGTITQLLVPTLLIIFSFLNRFKYLMMISLLLLAQNFANISVYAADAQVMKLKLFGPPGARHDWNWLLSNYQALQYSDDVSLFFVIMAFISVLIIFSTPLLMRD